jgi:cytochrome c-type biogenesis protein CcmH/NrfG
MRFCRALSVVALVGLMASPLLADSMDDDLAVAKGMLLAGNADGASDKLDELEAAARRAVALKPEDAHANYILGMAAMYAGDDALSQRALDMALKVEPKNPTYVFGRAELATYQNKSGEAGLMLQRFLEQEPGNVDAWEKLGSAQTDTKDFASARASFQKAADLAPKEPRYQAQVAESSLAMGKDDDAIAAYDKALAVDAKYGVALSGLGEIYLRQKAYDKARDCFERASAATATDYRSIARIVQIDQATGDTKGRDAAIGRIDALQKSGKIDATSFCREEIMHGKTKVMAFEYFPKAGVSVSPIYGFVVLKDDGKSVAQRIELAAVAKDAWLLSADDVAGHVVLGTDYKSQPTYEEARGQMMDYLDGKLKPIGER